MRKIFTSIFNIKEYKLKHFNYLLVLVVLTLGSIGMYLIELLQDADENLFERQIMGYALGLSVALFISFVDYHFVCKLFIPLYLLSLGLLLICQYSNSLPIYGWKHHEARRWIKIGGDPTAGVNNPGFEFQPSELTKIIMILFLAKLFDLCHKQIKKIWVLALASVLMGIPTVLILVQTDLSTAIVLFLMFIAMLYVAGISYKVVVPSIMVMVPIAVGLFWYIQQDFQKILEPYQQKRILAMLYPELYPDLAHQQVNAGIAIRSGGMIGKAITGDDAVAGSMNVPVKESDFIFSAIGEAFGFIGSCFVILLFAIFILLIFRIAIRARDFLGRMIAMGIGCLLMFQIFINIGVVTSLLPNTGIPLPFVSSGLSSLLGSMIMLGILLNISMQPKDQNLKESAFHMKMKNLS